MKTENGCVAMKILKKGKRGLALCIAMCLFWTLACFAVSRSAAAETAYTDTGQLSDGTLLYKQYGNISALTVTGTVSDCSGEVAIPAVYSGMSVVEIAAGAFSGQTGITRVTVPDTVQRIGTNAFKGCISLEQVDLENTIQYVGAGAFDETAWSAAHAADDMMILDDVVLISVSSTLEELYIPETVRVIADEACMEKTSLKTAILTGYVGDKSFYGCTGLTDVIFSNGIKSIGNYAFTDSAVSRIVIPATVIYIGKGAFLRCTALEQVILWDGIARIGSSAFASCTSLRQITIPDSVTELGSSAFKQCTGLQQAVIGKNVTEIQDYIFQGCTSLSSVTINGQVSGIGNGAFNKCTALQSVTLPESVVRIGSEAFQSCMSLSEVNIPENVIDIGTRAFFDTAFYNHLRAADSESCFVQYNDTILLGYYGDDANIYVPEGIRVIAGGAFSSNETIVSVILPSTIESLSSYAFESVLAMETVSGTENLKYIGAYAFWDCISFKYLNIKGDIGVIPEGVASGCESLLAVNIQDGITGIGTDAFRFSGLYFVSIPESVEYIRSGAFEDCMFLESIEILNKDTVLEERSIPAETEIRGYEGSTAHEYAIAYGNPFVIIDPIVGTGPSETTTSEVSTTSTTVTSGTTFSDTSYTTTIPSSTTSTVFTTTNTSGTYACALEMYTVEISREELEAGNYTVTVPVALNNTGGWKSLGYGFSYDTSQLTIESVEISSELAEWLMMEGGMLFQTPAVNHEKGLFWAGLSVGGDTDDLYCPDGIFSYITFTVNPSVQPGDICRITLLSENNGTKQLAETVNGSRECELIDGAVMILDDIATTPTTTTATTTTTTLTTMTTTSTTTTTTLTTRTTTSTTTTTTLTTMTTTAATTTTTILTTRTTTSTTTTTILTTMTTTTATTTTTTLTTRTTTSTTTTITLTTMTTTSTTTTTTLTTRTTTSTTTTTFQTTQTTSYMCGDLDGDGRIAIGDASIILSLYAQQAAGMLSEEDIIKKLPFADTDSSGAVEMNDAVLVLTYYAQICAGITEESFENWRTAQ